MIQDNAAVHRKEVSMKNFDLPIYQNPLKSKSDFEQFLMETLGPLEEAFVANGTRLHLSNTCSGARDEVSGIEGFSRIIWGLAVHDNMGPDHEWWVRIRRGLIAGTDPAHESYFGVVSDYDQRRDGGYRLCVCIKTRMYL